MDEAGLNLMVKNHKGRSPVIKIDALCIVGGVTCITKAYARIPPPPPNKKMSTIFPIVLERVEVGATIYTNEHKSYCKLNNLVYVHDSVCHRREYVNQQTGVSTRGVDSFNNELNPDLKKKGCCYNKRQEFLNEFMWPFNNSENRIV